MWTGKIRGEIEIERGKKENMKLWIDGIGWRRREIRRMAWQV